MIATETQTTVNAKLLDKIAKLLRLTESPNPHEAELALTMAKKLAVENDIDLASVEDTRLEPQSYEQGEIVLGKRKPVTGRFVCWIIQEHFNTSIVFGGGRRWGQVVHFVGKKKDIDISIYVFHFLNQTFMSMWHEYKKETECPASSRGSYFYGLYKGIANKLTLARQEAERQKFADLQAERGESATDGIKQSYALMVMSNKDQLTKAVGEFYPHLRKGGSYKINLNNVEAFSQGEEDGQTIEINPSIGNSRGTKVLA